MRREQAYAVMDVLSSLGLQSMIASGRLEDVQAGDLMEYAVILAPQPHAFDVVELAMAMHLRGYRLSYDDGRFVIGPPPEQIPQSDDPEEVVTPTHLDTCNPTKGKGTPGCVVCEAMVAEEQNVRAGRAVQTCLTLFGEFCEEIPCDRCGNGHGDQSWRNRAVFGSFMPGGMGPTTGGWGR